MINTERDKIQPQTGKRRKEVRFDISQDENADSSAENWGTASTGRAGSGRGSGSGSEDWRTKRAVELNKRRPIVLSFDKKCSLLARTLRCRSWRDGPDRKEKRDGLLVKMWQKGRLKLKEDFDVLKMVKTLQDLRVMFKYYRLKHADLMIEVNANRRSIINLEDDGWETELDRPQPYMTKFDTYESSSDDLGISDESGSYSRSRDRRSRSDKSAESSDDKSSKSRSKSRVQDLNPSEGESSEEEDEENNTVQEAPEQRPEAPSKKEAKEDLADQADFDDINESYEQDRKLEVKQNKPGPTSFSSIKNESIEKQKEALKKDIKLKALPSKKGNDKKDGKATPNTSFSQKSASHGGDEGDEADDKDPESSSETGSQQDAQSARSERDRLRPEQENSQLDQRNSEVRLTLGAPLKNDPQNS